MPVRSTQTAPASSAPLAASSTRDQVIAAYTGYWQAYAAASRSRNLAAATALLKPYAAAAYLPSLIGPLPRLWASHDMSYGYPVPHVLGIQFRTGSAVVHDCLDLSHFGTQNFRTGRVYPNTFGLPRVNCYVTLVRADRQWLVRRFQQVEVPCAP